jgi:hypothetical protein
MYWYLLFGLVLLAIVSGVLIYYLFYSFEGFQDSSSNLDLSGAALLRPEDFDISGLNLEQIAADLSGALQGATADTRSVESGPRLCEGFINQIAAMESAIEEYKSRSDWKSVRLTNTTLEKIRLQKTEAGC